jgi:hypothetical protein
MSARPPGGTCPALPALPEHDRVLVETADLPRRVLAADPGSSAWIHRPRGRRAPLPDSASVSACAESSATTASAHGPERAPIGRTKHSSRCGRPIVHPSRPPRISPGLSALRLFARFVPASCPGLADLPRSWAGSPGSILVSAASTGASATRPLNDPSMTAGLSHRMAGPHGAWRQEGTGGEVTRPRRCAGSRRADHRISGLPPAGLCRDDRPGRPGADAPSAKGVRALPQTHVKRHCAAPGFTHSGQRRFLPIFLPEEATQQSRGVLSPGHSSKME